MAYASKYYNPIKAHEYYMKTRELKGYEDRYGGHRYDGTSAASSGVRPDDNSPKAKQFRQKQEVQKHNLDIKSQIQSLRDQLSNMSSEERAENREAIHDQIQALRQQTKGGSTAGFNQKGQEAAAYIKDQMTKERDGIIKKTNQTVDKEMLGDVKRLAADIKAMRESGRGFSHKEFGARIKTMLGKAKKTKIKAKRNITNGYKQKYKDEIDKLRSDNSMFSYYDKKKKRNNL